MTVAPYITKPEDVVCSGWVPLGSIWVSREPLRDKSTGLYARLTWRGGHDACAALGARMVTANDVDALFAEADLGRALCLSPVELPDLELAHAAGVVLDWQHNAAGCEAFLCANMGGLAWAQHHDERVKAQLDALGWDGEELLVNVGKLWVSGVTVNGQLYVPPPGRAWLYGWREANRKMRQPRPAPGLQGPHGENDEHDYGTLVVAVSDVDPATLPIPQAA